MNSLFDGDAAVLVDVQPDAGVRLVQERSDAGVEGEQVVGHLQQLVTPQLTAGRTTDGSGRSRGIAWLVIAGRRALWDQKRSDPAERKWRWRSKKEDQWIRRRRVNCEECQLDCWRKQTGEKPHRDEIWHTRQGGTIVLECNTSHVNY